MVTQKDIARRLGISASLVSRALSGTAVNIGASAETVERIRAEAARLNYRPSAAALTLRGTSTQTLAVVIKNFDDAFFGRMIAEFEALAAAKQYTLLLTGCPPGAEPQVDIHSLAKYQLDGVAIVGSDFTPVGLTDFIARGVRVVRIGSGPRMVGVTNIVGDIEHGLAELVKYLAELGHRDIGYIGDETEPNRRREQQLVTTLKRADLLPRPTCFVRSRLTGAEAGYDAMHTLLKRCGDLRPTAIIAAEDALAQTALRALFERNLRVPADLSLASVDDIPGARMTIPALTTLRQPISEMVQRAFEILVGNDTSKEQIVVRPELVVRESCARIPKL
ncbi:MAG: HTH-type transcriptional regulator GalS [Verrucomicrobiae bacterium]|nr:HTH-type transcriptional regulator GalS [Verrucomicrobiae bacterium]